MKNKNLEIFSNKYSIEEKEILVLTNDQSAGGEKLYNSWTASQYFLAYFDIKKNELKIGDGRIVWLLTNNEYNQYGITYPYNFKFGTIYHLRVRELNNKTIPDEGLPSFYNRSMVVKVIEKNIQNDELLEVLKEYRIPIKITNAILGEFELKKDHEILEGTIDWLNESVRVSLEVDVQSRQTWNDTICILQVLFNEQKKRDIEFRTFAGEKLTG